jgi:hypothetical protein
MSAAWVCLCLILLIGDQAPVVKADEWSSPFDPPGSFVPPELAQAALLDPSFATQALAPLWYGEAGAVFYDRTRHGATLGLQLGAVGQLPGGMFFDINPSDNHLVSTQDLDFSTRPGLRFLVGRTIWVDPCDDRGCVAKPDDTPESFRALSAELGYLGLVQQRKSMTYLAAPDGSIISKFATLGPANTYTPVLWPFDHAAYSSLVYRSRFDSAELNLRYSTGPSARMPIDLLAGVRFVKLQENLDYLAANPSNVFGLTSPLPVGLYSTKTDNDLIGLQVGGDLSYRVTPNLSLIGKGRGGLLVNSATQRSNVTGTLIATNALFSDTGAGSGVGLAGLFEFGIHTNYQLSRNINLMFGYQGLFLSDLSTAPRQLNWSPELGGRNGLDRNGSLFFFGPAAGIEWKW